MYAFWGFWQLHHKVTFDGVNKIIIVNDDVTALNLRANLYSAWVEWIELETNSGYLPAMRYSGLDVIPGGFTGDIYFLINGWRLIIDLRKVAVTGVLYSENYPTAYYDFNLTPQYPATVSALVNTVVSYQNVVTGDIGTVPTAMQNAEAVRTNLVPELNKIAAQVDGLTPQQQTMLIELFNIMGLDPTKPLVVGNTNRTAGGIVQTIETTSTSTTIQRQ